MHLYSKYLKWLRLTQFLNKFLQVSAWCNGCIDLMKSVKRVVVVLVLLIFFQTVSGDYKNSNIKIENYGEDRHPRPRLIDIKTAVEIKKWLPSIKKEIEFCLTQSQVRCYTDNKVEKYKKQIYYLEIEYKKFLKKLKQLDPAGVPEPGVLIAYKKKSKPLVTGSSPCVTSDSVTQGRPLPINRISLPVLDIPQNLIIDNDKVTEQSNIPINEDKMNEPLSFRCKESKQTNLLGLDYDSD